MEDVSSLQKQHEQLDRVVSKMQKQPGSCDLEVKGLKTRKADLKQRIFAAGAETITKKMPA